MDRPELNKKLDSKTFRDYYYLKEELIDFCRKNNLQTTGSKIELTDRISKYLDTGEIISKTYDSRRTKIIDEITLDSIIEDNFVCSEKHRAFYKEQIGKNFSFNVLFQKWLKSNSGKTYKDSIEAYYKILEDKKKNKTIFNDNKDKTLEDAIKCWKYKKSLKGHNKYEKEDLKVLL